MIEQITDQLAILGHPQRITVFRMLVRRFPDSVPAGELASELGIKPSTMSNYLNALQRSGLVTQVRLGTSLRYSIDMANVQKMFDFLIVNCCRGRPDLCMPSTKGSETMTDRKFNVLFICVGNSARSIFAESLLREIGGDRFNVFSAGTQPFSQLNPFAVQVLQDKGHDTSVLRSKNVSEFSGPDAPDLDFVFTVCNQAANEECPAWEGQPISGHWGMVDPVKAGGTDAEKSLAFQNAYGALKRRIQAFTSLPVESLDRIALQSAVDDIGRTSFEDVK
ncbi:MULTISPECIES: helix-turn-helix domain-containing protein [unclassified Ruegeria]|uniref:arsenate reductase/protein-tyrosine-phosphatase family protein n=1 Tax=unclassified Ruegeria TaxID=2625375 RepID=UPI00149188A3|nr:MULTISPECIES: helix-turn-helix domain-containing protein [unclassified Ruegeria]NOD90137.1 helix-turn-helix domain-containing protein [Ruegeria sp. HKCCD4318]NOE15210.1 helix-turn-helix domain-containing protein [Ruegeria sp. HKCCD4318-2]NOG10580.1 helix-turn-helix domain-containing protein [Ruegeria sp. HKCCD4315]